MTEIRFYRSRAEFGFLSNLYSHPLTFEGIKFSSAEHAYQYGKSSNMTIREYIRNAPYPRLAAIVGHGLFMYDVVQNWSAIKVDRMRKVLEAKFSDPVLRKKLIATGDATLIEDSKTDAFWGQGKKGNGKNTLGVLLMELRGKLREESVSSKGK